MEIRAWADVTDLDFYLSSAVSWMSDPGQVRKGCSED